MANTVIPPNRENLSRLGFDLRTITFLENIGGFTQESVDDEDTVFNLLASAISIVGSLRAEIHELKKQVNDIENRDV